ncbi:hypothetical protein HV319_26505 (plasmid) [Citrobacter freundii]|nr:hypothetical protein [Citrobacter freundii]OPW88387.1 hypothetical protein BZK41_26550 [Citrobacter sp. A316]HCP9940546.1 hypothetical protein [Escherichia coli]MBJ9086008.1 hypothetical protein [Citrobacter freundii]QGJ44091.1 hypothetical protein E4179_28115 [Citrobacter freundii]
MLGAILKQKPGITPTRTPAVIRDGVPNMNISPLTVASPDSDATPLTNDQIDDLYYYVCQHGQFTDDMNRFYWTIEEAEEETAFFNGIPDYTSVFINEERWPVAAAAPMDNLYYLLG